MNRSLDMVEHVARVLGAIREEVVFVGDRILPLGGVLASRPAFAPDGTSLAYAVKVKAGNELRRVTVPLR